MCSPCVVFCFFFFFFNDTATTEIYTLSLHDALPISDCLSATTHRVNTRLNRLASHAESRAVRARDRSDERRDPKRSRHPRVSSRRTTVCLVHRRYETAHRRQTPDRKSV